MGTGELAGLAAAFFWASASMIWGRIPLTALGINLAKNVLGSMIIAVHLSLIAIATNSQFMSADAKAWGWLALSGVIGIAIGDTCYFRSLQIMGPQKTLMVASTAPIFSTLLGWLGLSQELSTSVLVGVLLTVIGVVLVVADRKAPKEIAPHSPGEVSTGLILGLMGAICQALGGMLSKIGMEGCPALQATLIRIGVATICIILWFMYQGKLMELTRRILDPQKLKLIVPATAVGTWMGIWMSQVAYEKTTNIAVAQTVLATSPIFALPMTYICFRHRATILSVLGTAIGILGIYFVVQK